MMKIVNSITKKVTVLSIILSLISCNFLSKETNAKGMKNNENLAEHEITGVGNDSFVVIPNYDHPEFKKLNEIFSKQEHRFEIDVCELKYNGSTFFIGDSLEKIVEIFGEPDGGISETLSKKTFYYNYDHLKLFISFLSNSKTLSSFTLNMSDYKGHENTSYDIIKFRNIPYQLDMTLNKFMELSNLNHDNVGHTSGDFYIKNERVCKGFVKAEIRTSIGSTPAFNSTGGGHMTISGDFDPNVTGPIEMLGVSLIK